MRQPRAAAAARCARARSGTSSSRHPDLGQDRPQVGDDDVLVAHHGRAVASTRSAINSAFSSCRRPGAARICGRRSRTIGGGPLVIGDEHMVEAGDPRAACPRCPEVSSSLASRPISTSRSGRGRSALAAATNSGTHAELARTCSTMQMVARPRRGRRPDCPPAGSRRRRTRWSGRGSRRRRRRSRRATSSSSGAGRAPSSSTATNRSSQ